MLTMAVVLGGVAGLLDLGAYLLYNKGMAHEESRPSVATWLLWVFISLLNSGSYLTLSGEWAKAIVPVASALACTWIFVLVLWRGKYDKSLNGWDKLVLGVSVGALVAWWHLDAHYANLCLQVAFAASFIPTVNGVWRDPRSEARVPWLMWTSAYVLLSVSIFCNWQSWSELVYPANGLMLNAAVCFLSRR